MFFAETKLYMYVTPYQVEQYKEMNPDAVTDAYDMALGYLSSEIGHIYDLPAMESEQDEEQKDKTLMWMLVVLTSWNLVGSSTDPSPTLRTQYMRVDEKIQMLKAGFSKFEEGTMKPEPNANIIIVKNAVKTLG